MHIDLNADVGELPDAEPGEAALVRAVTSVNIACGLHAGGPGVMRRTARLAAAAGTAIGAHPGFADRESFGRRELDVPAGEVEDLVLYQVSALAGIVAAEGGRVCHVKPHGALYHMAARDASLAGAVVAGVAAFDRSLRIVGPPGSALLAAAGRAGLPAAAEAFADRAYRPDGSLVSRDEAGAVIDDPDTVVVRALRLVRFGEVVAVDGTAVPVSADTICVHGDTANAAALAALLRRRLAEAGVTVEPLS